MRSRRLPLAALGCWVALAAVQGCGDGDRLDAVATSTPPATQPRAEERATSATPRLVADDRPARRGERATMKPLLRADAVLQVSAGEGLVAVAVGDASGSRLMVGRATLKGRLDLAPADGASIIPYWASIHVGKGPDGEPIVAYPSCSADAFASCTPMVWSARTRREARVPGFGQAGGTLEVAVDRGNAAVIATRDKTAGIEESVTTSGPISRIWVAEGGGRARRLDLDEPLAIALHGATLATVSDTGRDAGVCGEQLAQLWGLDDSTASPREVGTVVCGLGGSQIASAKLDARRARFVVANNGQDGYAELLTFDGAAGKTSQRRLGAEVVDVAWISGTVGITTGPPDSLNCAGEYIDTSAEPDPAVGPCELGRITLQATQP